MKIWNEKAKEVLTENTGQFRKIDLMKDLKAKLKRAE